jgi:hypothetical protein
VLSDDTTTKFRAALREHASNTGGPHDKVKLVIAGVAAEARDGGMSAAQFVIWIKKVWDEIMDEGALAHSIDPGRVRDVVISSAIKAYYVQ